MLKKTLIFFIVLVMLLPVAFAEIDVTRKITAGIESGKSINIEINVELNGEEPSSIVVTENIPLGWTVKSSTPTATSFDNQIKWLLYGVKLKDSIALKYSLQSPVSFDGSQLLSGNWKTLEYKNPIAGDLSVFSYTPEQVQEPESPTEPQSEAPVEQDYLMYIVAGLLLVIIVLLVVVVFKKK